MNASYYREPFTPIGGARGTRIGGRRGDAGLGVAVVLVGLLATPQALLGLEAWGAQASLGLTLVVLGLWEVLGSWGARSGEAP